MMDTRLRQRFLEIYSGGIEKKGAELGSNFQNIYSDNKKWTKEIISIAKKSIKELLSDEVIADKTTLKVSQEYFRIDIVGYLTQWEEEKKKKKMPERQHVWHLKVAYEHENSDDWSDELCKLCYIAANLRVIHSYYNPSRKKEIREQLQQYVDRLKNEDILNRIPDNNWLFIFGVLGYSEEPPKVFTLNESKKVESLKWPNEWPIKKSVKS